ncbi:dehydrogenase [Lysobacter xinjiangensis]|uniref:Dehydrogenase n=1 Tax=Cognatilysobacter xinjiangensis TaxID=546892 RepID=A0ABQ3C702_9GAMM|nr:dehydrogenase [Lysobacter xinjiangensis]GGZ70916.1 dehydrogenase [Lysobacter xinjiangensis]
MIVRARAPLRLGLAGGGTDVSPYCDQYGGFVMNAAIDRFAYATVDEAPGGAAEFVSLDNDVRCCWSPEGLDKAPPSLRLLVGVYARICMQFLDGRHPPIRIRTYSDAPPGSGLGSSSTLVVALVAALCEFFALPLGEYEIAHLAYSIEREDLALAGGKQDQYAAAFGGVNFMEFHAGDRVIVNPLRIKDWVLAELEASLVLYFTGVSRESARIIDEQVRNAASGAHDSVSAMHQLKFEAVQMKEALLKGDLDAFARTLQKGWEAKKRMASSVSNPVIDAVEAVAVTHGARATKVSGAGGGGFMMFVCDPTDRVRLSRALQHQGGQVMDFHFNPQGAVAWRAGR